MSVPTRGSNSRGRSARRSPQSRILPSVGLITCSRMRMVVGFPTHWGRGNRTPRPAPLPVSSRRPPDVAPRPWEAHGVKRDLPRRCGWCGPGPVRSIRMGLRARWHHRCFSSLFRKGVPSRWAHSSYATTAIQWSLLCGGSPAPPGRRGLPEPQRAPRASGAHRSVTH